MRLQARLILVALGVVGSLLGAVVGAAASATPDGSAPSRSHEAGSYRGDVVCLSARIPEGVATACAHRVGFGVDWALSVEDAVDDGRSVRGTIALDVADARDSVASISNDLGVGSRTVTSGSFRPRFGSAIDGLELTVCVDIRFLPDRCRTESVAVPQPAGHASPQQAARLEQLAFDLPLDEFVATWNQDRRSGVDADFDWSSDGCSAGPVAPVFGQFLEPACLRHDFAYRNYGQLGYDPSDETRRRVDEQLAVDAETLGRGDLADSLTWALQRFAAPVFFGDELAQVWGVPTYLATWLRTAPNDSDGPP